MNDLARHRSREDDFRDLRATKSALHKIKQQAKAQQKAARAAVPSALLNMFPYKTHPWTAQKFITELERRHLGAAEWLEGVGADAWPDALMYDKNLDRGVRLPADPALQHHMMMTAQEVGVHNMWDASGRTVLEIHPGLTPHLRTAGSDKFPPMVLQHLTHENPLVFLGAPVDLRDSAGKPIRLIGWYIVGSTSTRQYVSSTDGRAANFHLTAVSEVLSDDGTQTVDWDHTRITIPIRGQEATVEEVIAGAIDRFAWDPLLPNQEKDLQESYLSGMLHVIVPHLLYLVSQNLETKPKPFIQPAPPRRNKWDRKRGGGPVNRHLVGFVSGPTLAALDRWESDEVRPGEARGPQDSRKGPRAHVRRAHFHTYYIGKGTPTERKERGDKRVKWLPPIPINADGSAATTVIKVK